MKINVAHLNKDYLVDLSKPLDISIPLDTAGPICFHAPNPKFEPVATSGFIGDIEAGSPVNFYNVSYNPHGNGTHTETQGHISKEKQTINQTLKTFHFVCQLITVEPALLPNGDYVIKAEMIPFESFDSVQALVIRTLPNARTKLTRNYSDQNPPYMDQDCMDRMAKSKIQHLLIDLPSVDKEIDGGALASHKSFWNGSDRAACTITELIYVDNDIADGCYLLNLMISPLELDAVSSKPILYKMEEKNAK